MLCLSQDGLALEGSVNRRDIWRIPPRTAPVLKKRGIVGEHVPVDEALPNRRAQRLECVKKLAVVKHDPPRLLNERTRLQLLYDREHIVQLPLLDSVRREVAT